MERHTLSAKTAAYWKMVSESLVWSHPWTRLVSGRMPNTKWFLSGKLNASVNCLDRHMGSDARSKTAIVWESEQGDVRRLTYSQLHTDVQRCANVLRSLGVKKGDRVVLYMGLVPEAVVAMLACARIGAIHVVVFGGFGIDALATRINDVRARCVVTCDVAFRNGKTVPLKKNVDAALRSCPSVRHVLVYRRDARAKTGMTRGRDRWWHEEMRKADPIAAPAAMESEDILFVLHTSGTTGKPKGIVHTTAGYLAGVSSSFRHVFGPKDSDVYWCTADIGWITGHSYVVYGPLMNGMTVLLYEGGLEWPKPDRIWRLCAKHKVTILYTAPTAIRSFMKSGYDLPKKHDLSALRLLGSVGEPINPEAWRWYKRAVGNGRCPIVDTWWQTETGMIMISPPVRGRQKPGCAARPLPGVEAAVVDKNGKPAATDEAGFLVIRKPWPSMLRGIWNDPDRFRKTYWNRIRGCYFTHDRAKRDVDGDFWILGRTDDVLIVAGHNLSNAEIESSLTQHPAVVEAAVVGIPDAVTGQRIIAFVIPRRDVSSDDALVAALRSHVGSTLGPVAKPKEIYLVPELPKTRSGKIIRRLLRMMLTDETPSELTTLANPGALTAIQNILEG